MGLDKKSIMLWYHWQKKIIVPEKRIRRWEITPVLTIISTNVSDIQFILFTRPQQS